MTGVLTLKDDRIHFTALVSQFLSWFIDRSQTKEWSFSGERVEIALDEWTVHSPRLVKIGFDKVMAFDAVHSSRGQHPKGLAVDLLIYIDGEYLRTAEHPIWAEIDAWCRSKHPDFGLGIAFGDANHLSFRE